MEGRTLLSRVPVLGEEITEIKPRCLGNEIARALKWHKVVLVQGHGSFAVGQLLEEAYYYTSVLEQSCQVLYLREALRINSGANS